MDATRLRLGIIRPTLTRIELASPEAEELLMGIAAQETHMGELGRVQLGGGPALGLWQMEPATFKLTIRWTKRNRPKLYNAICEIADTIYPEAHMLARSDELACAMARALCLSIPGPLPDKEDVRGQGVWYKRYWNRGGKGSAEQYIANYYRYVRPAALTTPSTLSAVN